MKTPHLGGESVPVAIEDLLGVGVDIKSLVAWYVDNGDEQFVRLDARNAGGDVVLGVPLSFGAAVTLADQLRMAADEGRNSAAS